MATGNANDILGEILNVCRKISEKLDKNATPKAPTGQRTSAAGNVAAKGAGMTGFAGFEDFDDKKSDERAKNMKTMAEALKVLGSGIADLSKGLWKFWLVPAGAKRRFSSFMLEMKMLAMGMTAGGGVGFKKLAEGMETLGDALPKLAGGVMKFGLVAKTGLVSATTAGLLQLYGVMVTIGNPATAPLVLVASAAIASLGVALNGIANVLKGLAVLVLGFAGAVVIMVGAIFTASKLFNVGPLQAMLIVVGAIGILAAGFALIGVLSPLILASGAAVSAMGIGLGLIGVGLLAFIGSVALMNKILGTDKTASEVIVSMIKPLALLSLLFAAIGIFGGMIKKGAEASQEMGKGMIFLAGGILALGLVGGILNAINVDIQTTFGSIAGGVLKLALMFAILGVGAMLIVPGTFVLLAIAASVVLFGLAMLGVGAIIAKLGGADGLATAQQNVSDLISSVLIGVIGGVSRGLLGEDGDSKGFFGKVGTVAKNVAILIGSIGLLMGVSFALIMFAQAVKAFTSAGIIKTITGYDAQGNPIFGESVDVTKAAENIAVSSGSFFTTLTTTFTNRDIIPDKDKIEDMVDILMGNTGFKLFGLQFGTKRPGLLDALGKFSEVIGFFAKTEGIPTFNTKGKVTGYIKPGEVASNIVSSLVSFFKTFNDNKDTLENISSDSLMTIAEVLMGRDSFKILGLKTGKGAKPGLLEPLMKFAELLKTMGSDPGKMTYVDADGKTQTIDTAQSAGNIVRALTTFATSISNSLSNLEPVKPSKSGLTALQSFDMLNDQFRKLIKQKDGLQKTSEILEKFAGVVGKLGSALTDLDKDKLAAMASISAAELAAEINEKESWLQRTADKLSNPNVRATMVSQQPITANVEMQKQAIAGKVTQQTQTAQEKAQEVDWSEVANAIGIAVATEMKRGTFNFVFDKSNSGVIMHDS